MELQQGFIDEDFKLKGEINLTNSLGADLIINGIFIANGSNPAVGTSPGDLILYTVVFSDENDRVQESIDFPSNKDLLIDVLELRSDVLVI